MINQSAIITPCLLAIGAALLCLATHATAADAPMPGRDALPSIKDLPDPFLLKDGSRLKTKQQWQDHRAELSALILGYEYGRMPAATKDIKPEDESTTTDPATGATEKKLSLNIDGKIKVKVIITTPKGDGPFPTIIKGDLCWNRILPEMIAAAIKRNYVVIEFDRTDFAPDQKGDPGGIRPAYPDSDWGALAAWAWGFHRVTDYALTQKSIDPKHLVITGHSRGGKAALLAGALDERYAIVAPNGSGCGGAGCYRVNPPKTEDIAAILKQFPYWFAPNFGQFIGHIDRLPFDQHTIKALVAPRALLTTEALGDIWANSVGTQVTHNAAKEVYKFLGVPDKIAINYREGKHEQNQEDWTALLDFADQQFFQKSMDRKFNNPIFPDAPKGFDWSAPTGG